VFSVGGQSLPSHILNETEIVHAFMKIFFLNTLGDPTVGGGAEITIWSLMRSIQKMGHQCVILSVCEQDGLSKSEREGITVWQAGLKNFYFPSFPSFAEKHSPMMRILWHALDSYNPFMQKYLKTVLDIECPDVVSSHNLSGWSSAAWTTISSVGLPIVQVLHDQYSICPKTSMLNKGSVCERQCLACSLMRIPHRRLSNKVTALVGVSKFIIARHEHFGYFSEVPFKNVIHDARDKVNLGVGTVTSPHNGLRIGFIGSISEHKGVHVLMKAFMEYENTNAELWIAGNGSKNYLDYLKSEFIDDRVKYLGHVKPKDFYPLIDFTVVPSLWYDTFPGVVFESLSFGKPVIGSCRGGIPEMVTHGENGFMFNPDDTKELVNYLEILGNDADKRQRMGMFAVESVKNLLDINKWAQNYIDTYKMAISIKNIE